MLILLLDNQQRKLYHKMQKSLVCLVLLPFFIMVCAGGEFSESESFFSFIRAIDPQNVLNISKMDSSNPCLLKHSGIIRCNSKVTNIIEIRLQNLNLSGIIDADSLCRLQKLRSVNLAKNYIRGNIPNSVLHCTRLVYLNLSNNLLSGRVPKALRKLRYLRNLDISNNNFYGIIASQQEFRHLFAYSEISRISKTNSTRKWLKVEYTIQSTLGPDPYNNSESSTVEKPWYKDEKTLVPIIIGVGLFLVFIYFVGRKAAQLNSEREGLEIHQESSMKKPKPEVTEEMKLKKRDEELVFFVEEDERFTLEDLLQATADLRNESFCSSLYKVVLKNNMHYVVKRLKNLQVSSDEFGETLGQISNLKHPNILPPIGYRSTSEEKLLIYKYQSNGSLLCLLKEHIGGKKEFRWKLRLSIAAGIARGLGFIYQKLEGREIIPHGNLKLSNILLSDDNEPLISEHGLSKFLDPNRAFLFASHGYTAPEKSLTEKGDVYSFGVILLELLTGKSIEINNIDLPRWVRSMVREEWTGEVFDKEVREAEYQWAFPVLNIALMCVSHVPENRPTMEEVREKIDAVIYEHEQLQLQEEEHFCSTCCNDRSKHEDCCSLHKIIPETWDSPGSNY